MLGWAAAERPLGRGGKGRGGEGKEDGGGRSRLRESGRGRGRKGKAARLRRAPWPPGVVAGASGLPKVSGAAGYK